VNLAAKLVAEHGEPLQTVCGDGLTHIFPTPDRIAQANLLGMPAARAQALSSVAAAASANPNLLRGRYCQTPLDPRYRRMDGTVHRHACPA
jgi:3-methyladenine DNA glycosylase/8-oxoguanine DNA glycosylase